MSQVKAPQFLSDLYRDLRDRRLLIPAVVLAIALVAVPMVIAGGGSEPAPAPAPSPLAAGDATEVESAVLVEETGVRDYRKRLEALKRSNPFEQKFAAPTPESVALEEPAPTSGAAPIAATTTTSGVSDPSSAATTSPSVSPDPGPVSTPPGSGSIGAVEPAEPTRVVEERFYGFRIAVAVGPLGEVKKVDDVRELDFLPSAKAPVVAFLGVDESGGKATFVLDADVLGSRGDGRCLGGGEAGVCQFLVLKRGEERIFDFGPGVPAQRLKLLDVRTVEIKDPTRDNKD